MSEVTLESQLIEIIKDEEMAENIKLAKIDMLVRLGVDVNAMYGVKSLLKLANEVKEEKIAKFLEENGAKEFFDEKIAKELGVKLIKACQGEEKKDVKEIKELIDMGADVNQKNETGKTALMMASIKGYKEVVEFLIQKEADVNQKDDYGWTALMWTSRKGRNEIVKLLIQKGADVNQKDYYGWTALMEASKRGHKEVVELLIQKGADVNQKDNNGQNAMMRANNDEKIKKAIIEAVKKRNEKTGENVIVQGIERE